MPVRRTLYISLLLILMGSLAWADPLKEILYTKKTTLLYPKTYDFTFSLWTDAVSTDPADMVWSEDQTIALNGPKLVTYLGKVTPLNISDFTQQLWVQVEYQKKTGITKVVGTRDRLSIVPYAIQSFSSQTLIAGTSVTSVATEAGSGLTNNQTAGDITLSTDPSILQRRVAATCDSGSAIAGIAVDGTVNCAPTSLLESVTAGTGLTGGGTTGNVTIGADFGVKTDQVARGNHGHNYGKVAVVAQSGGDYTDPIAAMADLSTWCGVPSSTNPCLLKIMPGVYDIGTNSLQMQPYVDIEGSGENVTMITGFGGSCGDPYILCHVLGSDNAEMRFLTISKQNIGAAILNRAASPSLHRLTILASDISTFYGIVNDNSSPEIRETTITSIGSVQNGCYGVYNINSSKPSLFDVQINLSGGGISNIGIHNDSSSLILDGIRITVEGAEMNNYGISSTNTSLSGKNISIKCNGGSDAVGIAGDTSEISLTMLSVSISGGLLGSAGIAVSDSSLYLSQADLRAAGPKDNIAIRNWLSTLTLRNVSAVAESSNNYSAALSSYDSASVTIDLASFEGALYSIDDHSSGEFKIGSSKLTGPVNGTGTFNCFNVYDGTTYTALDATCH